MKHYNGMKLVSTVLVLAGAVIATGFATGCDDGGAGTGGGGGSDPATTATTGSTNPATTTTGSTNPTTTTTTTGGGGEGIECPASYCKVGAFSGYGFVYSDMKDGGASTITQKGTSLCASGVAGAVVGMAYDKFWGAGIGVNLNQAAMTDAPINTAQLTGTGVTVGISNPPKTEVRVVVDEGGVEYCAVLTGASTTVKWTDFNTTCWDKTLPAAKALAGAPLSKAIKVQVITGDADRPFDYCISSINFN